MKINKKLSFSCDYNDFENLENVLKRCPQIAEEVINNYLKTTGKEILVDKTTFYIPVSRNPSKKREMHHAKNNKWYETVFKNLEIDLSNRTSSKNSYYYLYYVANYTGTSNPRKQKTGVGGIDFFTKGADMAYPNIKGDLLNILSNKIKEEI